MTSILDGGQYFVPQAKPVYWCGDLKMLRDEVKLWLEQNFGIGCTAVFVSVTAFGDQQDVFVLAEAKVPQRVIVQ